MEVLYPTVKNALIGLMSAKIALKWGAIMADTKNRTVTTEACVGATAERLYNWQLICYTICKSSLRKSSFS